MPETKETGYFNVFPPDKVCHIFGPGYPRASAIIVRQVTCVTLGHYC